MDFFKAIFGGIAVILVIVFGIPILIFMVLGEMFLGIFGIKVKDKEGNDIKSWVDDKSKLGLAILFIPFAILLLILAIYGCSYIFFLMREFWRNGSPILIGLGVIVPIVGVCLFANGLFAKK